MQDAVIRLLELGPFPPESAKNLTIEKVDVYANLMDAVHHPLTNQEAEALCTLFGDDNFYGLAWTMLHLIETAPAWPIKRCLDKIDNIWIVRLRQRAEDAGLM